MSKTQVLPETLLDTDGYPTAEWLEFIRNYVPDESLPVIRFVEDILQRGIWMPNWCFTLGRLYDGKRKLLIHTGGWSGNEEIVNAILLNMHLTHFKMRYVKWTTGGHYYFEIKVK